MCRLFPTCLEGPAWEWYNSLPAQSISTFDQLVKAFLGRFGNIRKTERSYESLLSFQQGKNESTRKYVDRFVEAAQQVKDFDDKVALLAIRRGPQGGIQNTSRVC